MTASTPSTTYGPRRDGRNPSQILALVIGASYTVVGLLGFAVTGFDDFAGESDETLLGFAVNPLHNLVHLAIGLAGLLMWRTIQGARYYGLALLLGYGATFVYGLFAVNDADVDVLNINAADNGLHIASALLGLVTAAWPVREHREA